MGSTTTTTFVAVVSALTALLIWTGPSVPWALLTLGVGVWAVNVALWRPPRWTSGYVFIGVLIACLVKLDLSQLPLLTRLIGAGVILLCLGAAVAVPIRRTDHFPIVHVFCVVAAVYVAVGTFVSHQSALLTQTVTTADRRHGLLLFGLFLGAVITGAAVASGRVLHRAPGPPARTETSDEPDVQGPAGPERAVALIVAGLGLGVIIRGSGLEGRLGLIIDLVYCLRLLGYLILVRMWLDRRRLPPWALAVLGAGLLLDVVIGLGSASLYQAARTPFAMAIMYVHLRRRIPWVVVAVAAVAILTLNVPKAAIRERAGGLGRLNRGNLVNQGISYAQRWIDTTPKITQEELSASASRLAYSSTDLLGYISRRVPRDLPYWDARTYRYIPLVAIPRVLAPWKPSTFSGIEFGQQYQLVNPGSTSTSANLPLSVEAYVNYGVTGIVLVGLAFGLLLGLLGRILRGNTWPLALTGAVVGSQLIAGVESDSSVVIGIAIWLGLFAYPMARWAVATRAGRWSRSEEDAREQALQAGVAQH